MRDQPGNVIHEDSGHAGTIAATATPVPRHILTSNDVRTYIRKVFDLEERRLDAMMAVIDNAQVYKRHADLPAEREQGS
jgi:predicted naringenin-chalcone synthase